MRFTSMEEYNRGQGVREDVEAALNDPDTVVFHYVEGFYTSPVKELALISTTPSGALVLVHKDGTMSSFNFATDRFRAQHVPMDMFMNGPSDGAETLAAWNEFKQRRDRAAMDVAQGEGEA